MGRNSSKAKRKHLYFANRKHPIPKTRKNNIQPTFSISTYKIKHKLKSQKRINKSREKIYIPQQLY